MSFDFVPDKLGMVRTKFPHTAYMVAGTQAASRDQNQLQVMRLSDMYRTKHDEGSSDTEDDDTLLDDLDDDPVLNVRAIWTNAGVNRVRVLPQKPSIVATWLETGEVRMYQISSQLTSLESTPIGGPNPRPVAQKPIQSVRHRDEGFAMAWSHRAAARFISGDCASNIHLWMPTSAGTWAVDSKSSFQGHQGSVEDLQWSPKEDPIFASASVDRTIRIWDCRRKAASVGLIQAHSSDVNVLSWNRLATHLLVSGSDDHMFKIWDLRFIKKQAPLSPEQPLHKPFAYLNWHKEGITSLEWHPTEKSTLAVSSGDDTISLWDLNVKTNDQEDIQATIDAGLSGIPPQLLFLHHGQQHIKELHWHPQIPSLIASTSASGFHIFKTINV